VAGQGLGDVLCLVADVRAFGQVGATPASVQYQLVDQVSGTAIAPYAAWSGAAVAPCAPTPRRAPAVRTDAAPMAMRFVRVAEVPVKIVFLFIVDPFDCLRPVRR